MPHLRRIGLSQRGQPSARTILRRAGRATGILMTNPQKYHTPAYYRIRLKGRLNRKWSAWFDEMAISTKVDETILTGLLADQAALHGLLIKIRDLNLTLLSAERLEADPEDKQ